MKKHTVIIIVAAVYGLFRLVWPPYQSNGQIMQPVKKDTVTQLVVQGLKAADSANKTFDKILYRKKDKKPERITVYKIKKVYVKERVYDTVIVPEIITRTKYIAVPTKDYYEKHIRQENDSIKQVQADSLKPKKHGFIYRVFHKNKKLWKSFFGHSYWQH